MSLHDQLQLNLPVKNNPKSIAKVFRLLVDYLIEKNPTWVVHPSTKYKLERYENLDMLDQFEIEFYDRESKDIYQIKFWVIAGKLYLDPGKGFYRFIDVNQLDKIVDKLVLDNLVKSLS